MKAEFIKLDNCNISVQTTRPMIDGVPQSNENIMVIDNLKKSEIKDGSLVLHLTNMDAIILIRQLTHALTSVPF